MTFSTTVVTRRFGELAGDLTGRCRRRSGCRSSSCPASRSTGRCGSPRLAVIAYGRSGPHDPRGSTCPARARASARSAVSTTAMEQLHAAIIAAGIEVPVIVGHSGAGNRGDVLASEIHGARHRQRRRGCSTSRNSHHGCERSNRSCAATASIAIWDEFFQRGGGPIPTMAAMLRASFATSARCDARLTGRRCLRRHRPRKP